MSTNDICLIILQYNKSNLTLDCLNSIKEKDPNFNPNRIVIADNDSDVIHKEALKGARDLFPRAEILYHDENYGFGVAHNMIMQSVKEKYSLFLNNDTILINDALSKIYSEINSSKANFVTGTLYNKDGSFQENCGGYFLFPHPVKHLYLNILNKFAEKSKSKHNYCNGALLALKTDDFRQVGGFDRRLFMYTEDLDLMIKLNKEYPKFHGYRLRDAKVIHLGGASALQLWTNDEKIKCQIEQGNKVVKRHYGWFHNFVYAAIYAGAKVTAALMGVLAGSNKKKELIKAFYRITL